MLKCRLTPDFNVKMTDIDYGMTALNSSIHDNHGQENSGVDNPTYDVDARNDNESQLRTDNGDVVGDQSEWESAAFTPDIWTLSESKLDIENGDVGDDNSDGESEAYTPDIWALPEFKPDITPWEDLTKQEKIKRVVWHYIGKTLLFLLCLYIFICSLSFLGDAFQLLGGKTAGRVFTESKILSNPVAGLMIGILATVLLQSSSTTTSIVISMVAADILTVRLAIPVVMGANIGTTVTNTIVSLGQITSTEDFRRAFAGATVHDLFNFLTVCVLLPVEVITGYLERLSGAIVNSANLETNVAADKDYLKVITKPLTELIIMIDKNVIKDIAKGETDNATSIVKQDCKGSPCEFMFAKASVAHGGSWGDTGIGVFLLLIALVLLCVCLVGIIRILHSLLKGHVALWIRSFINANFPGKFAYLTGYLAILLGAGCTILLQSSSIFTSSLTPLVGMGVLSLERMYPLTLGSNIGTTGTGILASFALEGDKLKNTLQIALCHLFFNITGIIIFYPLPFFRPPINGAKFLGIRASKYRWFAIVYLLVLFLIVPAIGFGLSVAHWVALAVIFIPVVLIILAVVVIKVLQKRWPHKLPEKLQDWKWMPIWCRSLEPWDIIFMKMLCNFYICKRVGICRRFLKDGDFEGERQENENNDNQELEFTGEVSVL